MRNVVATRSSIALLRSAFSKIRQLVAVRYNVTVEGPFHLGPRSVVSAPVSLKIGSHVYVGKNCTIEVDGTIGPGTIIANNVGIVGRRDHNMRQIGVPIRLSRHVFDDRAAADELSLPVTIGPDVWVGFGSVVLSGVTIGRGSIVAAGSVVRDDVAKYSIVSGNPAVVIGQRFKTPSEILEHEFKLERDYGIGIRSV